jgi:hypothetical protein
MNEQKKWGIFKGFIPPPAEARWHAPGCPHCGTTRESHLLPWIDWWSIGTIAHCQRCTRFFHVSSTWEQIPGTHSREERERLVSHEVVEVEFDNIGVSETAQVWSWHETLPSDIGIVEELNSLLNRTPADGDEAVLLRYMLWTIVWNLNVPSVHLLEDFFEFDLDHPQYLQYKNRTVWLGHEVDLAESLERRYPDQAVRALHEVWKKRQPSDALFKAGLGFFVPKSPSTFERFGTAFASAASEARKRL